MNTNEPWNVPGKTRKWDKKIKAFVPSDMYLLAQQRKSEIGELLAEISDRVPEDSETLSLLRLAAHLLKPRRTWNTNQPSLDGRLLALADDAVRSIKYACEGDIKDVLETVALPETLQSCLRAQQKIMDQLKPERAV